ncbi:hypothetical protein MSG28_002642 [Choristoneura fumiferana]|uniref:Uncharacterized protein n=1 Tax=Choristoneura fumiferana TaxID=7141 RepID=A0ACC0JIM8_CHOFU|nr:hypothetical protein MSG28_002642 [Choristoneura fumiferana]
MILRYSMISKYIVKMQRNDKKNHIVELKNPSSFFGRHKLERYKFPEKHSGKKVDINLVLYGKESLSRHCLEDCGVPVSNKVVTAEARLTAPVYYCLHKGENTAGLELTVTFLQLSTWLQCWEERNTFNISLTRFPSPVTWTKESSADKMKAAIAKLNTAASRLTIAIKTTHVLCGTVGGRGAMLLIQLSQYSTGPRAINCG